MNSTPLKSLALLLLLGVASALAKNVVIYEPYDVTTVYGWAGVGSQDGTGVEARFNNPFSGAFDQAGNLYVSDTSNETIRKITPAGVVTTFAGAVGQAGSADGQGSAARFNYPIEIAIDKAGNLFVADESNNTIRKITPDAVVTTIAGSPGVFGHVDGPGAQALFSYPYGMVIDSAGNLFISEAGNEDIRKITPDYTVSTFAGGPAGDNDGTGTAASFTTLAGIGIDRNDNIYAMEWLYGQVRMITPAAVVTHYNRSAAIPQSQDVAVDRHGNLFTAGGFGARIYSIPPTGPATTFAGGYPGSEDGTGDKAQFNNLYGVTFDAAGNLYAIDVWNKTVRRVTPKAVVTTVAGLADRGSRDAVGIEARFYYPWGIVSDGAGGFYVCDSVNDTIRKIDSAGAVTTIAGKVFTPGLVDGRGLHARFNDPTAIARDAAGNLYVADSLNNAVRKINPAGVVTTLAPGTTFTDPKGIAVDAAGNVYVAMGPLNEIDKITPSGAVSVFASGLRNPLGLAIDPAGNLLVADYDDSTIRKVSPAGVVTTVAGNGTKGHKDGPAASATFQNPSGLTVDAAGNIFVCDTDNHTIRKISVAGQVTTLAGSTQGWQDGTAGESKFSYPQSLAVDSSGALTIADYFNSVIRRAVPTQSGKGKAGRGRAQKRG